VYFKSINKLPVDIERISLEKYLRPINTARKKRLKKFGEAIAFRELIFKKGQILEINLPKRLYIRLYYTTYNTTHAASGLWRYSSIYMNPF
jgi:hypothetical protein